MNQQPSLFQDFYRLVFSSSQFFSERFLQLSEKRIFLLGYIGMLVGLITGSLLTFWFADSVQNDFASKQELYLPALQSLGLQTDNFLELMKIQQAYSLLLALLSPVIAFIAPHILGGALFFFLWLLYRPQPIEFARVMETARVSLGAMVLYSIPGVGPLVAIVCISLNLSRALMVQIKLVGFLKALAILATLYFCFFFGSATLQILAIPLAQNL